MNSTRTKLSSFGIIAMIVLSGLTLVSITMSNSIADSITSPSPSSGSTVSGTVTFQCTSSVGSDVEFRMDGVLVATMSRSGTTFSYTVNTTGWTDGSHMVRYDSFGSSTDDVMSYPIYIDNKGPSITNTSCFYPVGQTTAKPGDKVTILAEITDAVSGVGLVVCDARSIGSGAAEKMYDDGLHNDGSPYDGIYGTSALNVTSGGGYWGCYVHARDVKGNFRNVTAGCNVDIYEPTILEIDTVLPAGQTAVKNGDKVRITAKALDYKILISDKVAQKPLDVVLCLDNSGSMWSDWSNLETAATTFIDKLSSQDRCAIIAFDYQGGWPYESVKQYSTFLYMDQTYNDPQGTSYTSTGRNVSKFIVTVDDGFHLTSSGGNPGCNTPIWDTIGTGIQYAINNRRTDAVPVVIAMTDGDDVGSGGRERGSETYCPGAPSGALGQTWTVSGGCIWGSPPRTYSTVQRELNTVTTDTLTTITPGASSTDRSRTGLLNATIPVFTIGLGISPQGTNSSAPGYYNPPTHANYKYTTEYDLKSIGNSSLGGKYYYAPTSNQLAQIYTNVSEIIQQFGVSQLGLEQPHGIGSVQADLSSLGIGLKVNMFDDGLHGDGKANDDIYGSDLVTVNALETGNIVFDVAGTDNAGNTNSTQFLIELDNTQPEVFVVNTTYPPGRDDAQDGSSVFMTANTTDGQTGLGAVYLDASNIGGSTQVPMWDNGQGNDQWANDGVYTSENVTIATGLVSGVYTYIVNSYDEAGNLGSLSGNIDINNDVDIIFTNLINGQTLSGTFDLQCKIDDPDGIPDDNKNPYYRLDANPWYDMSLLSGKIYNATLDTTGYLDGPHTIYVKAKDTFGAESTETINIVVDNTAPSMCSIIAPISGQYIEGIYSLKTTAIDGLAIGNVTITIYNATGVVKLDNGSMGYNSGTGYYEFVLGTETLADGEYTAVCWARDKSGLTTVSAGVSFRIDNSDPVMSLVSPTNGAITYGTWTMQVTVTDAFLDTVDYNVDNSGWVDIATKWNTKLLSDGSHNIQLRAEDLAGHIVTESITVTIDNHDPKCNLNLPSQGQFIEGIYVLRAIVSDEVGLKSVKIIVNNSATGAEVLNTSMGYNAGTGYYESIFDTTTVVDGNYTALVEATDFADNLTIASAVGFQIDNNAPTVTLHSPLDGDIVFDKVLFNITITEEPFLRSLEYNIDSSGWVNVTEFWNTTNMTDGYHDVEIRARDLAGHFVIDAIEVIVDNNDPTAMISLPSQNQFIKGIYTLRAIVGDLVGIDTAMIKINNTDTDIIVVNNTMGLNSGTGYYEYIVDTLGLIDGNYSAEVYAWDLAGNLTISKAVDFHIDNNAPVLTIKNPLQGSMINGTQNMTVELSTEPFLRSLQYNVDSSGWVNTTKSWNTSRVSDGEHVVQFRAQDLAGHETLETITVTVDNNDPEAFIVSPTLNEYISGSYTFSVSATDEVGIKSVVLRMLGDQVFNATYNTQSSTYEITVDTTNYYDGFDNMMVFITDTAGRRVVLGPRYFYIDNYAPEIDINYPIEQGYVEGFVNFDINVWDHFNTLSICQYNVDNKGWVSLLQDPANATAEYMKFEGQWNTSELADGPHTIQIRAVDPADHVTSYTINVIVDNHAPTCEIHTPIENQYMEGVVTFKVTAMDEVGISRVVLDLFNTQVNATFNSQSGYYEYSVDSKVILEDGLQTISVVAYDFSGKTSADGPINFNIDNTPPKLIINSPANGAFVNQTVVINATNIDTYPVPTEYNIDSSGWKDIGVPWDTTKVNDGTHTISIRARDAIGHETVETLTVVVDNSFPVCTIHNPSEGQFYEDSITFKVLAIDTLGIDRVELHMFAGSPYEKKVDATYNSVSNYYEYTQSLYGIMDGTYFVGVTAYDMSHKSVKLDQVQFMVDQNDPVLEIKKPVNGEYLSGLVEVDINAKDSFNTTIRYNVDKTGWVIVNPEGSNIIQTTEYKDGEHTIEVTATDEAGHQTLRVLNVLIDNQPPDINIVSPRKEDHLTGTNIVKVYCHDQLELSYVTITIDNGSAQNIYMNPTTGMYEYPVDTTLYSDGKHSIIIRAFDVVGSSSFQMVPVNFNNQGPDVNIGLIPAEGKDEIEFRIPNSDNATSMKINIDGSGWMDMSYDEVDNSFFFVWATEMEDNGRHTYQILAVDEYGNEKVRSGEINVENTEPTDYLEAFYDLMPLILFILLILFIILVIVVLVKTGKAKQWVSPAPEEEEEQEEEEKDEEELDEDEGSEDEEDGESGDEGEDDDEEDSDKWFSDDEEDDDFVEDGSDLEEFELEDDDGESAAAVGEPADDDDDAGDAKPKKKGKKKGKKKAGKEKKKAAKGKKKKSKK